MTGGAGFIGSHLCDRLIADGHTVLCVDNFLTGREANLRQLGNNPRFHLLRHDVHHPLEVEGPLEEILHFASPASPLDYAKYPIETLEAGSLGTLHMLRLAQAKRAGFLLASTSEVYGDPAVHPQLESYWGHVNPIGPRSCYDEAKRFAEALTMAFHRAQGVKTRILRIFNTYGPRMKPQDGRAIPTFLCQALASEPITIFGDGSQTRSFCYVSDLVEGIVRAMRSGLHDPVNLGNPQEMTLLDLAKCILKLTQSRSPLVFKPLPQDDPRTRRPDISRAARELGWQPSVSLEEGLTRTLSFLREPSTD
jgi:dTDP-glucose 4,6-dehydratase